MNVFCPVSTHSSPSRRTVVRIPPKASEPASGSVIAQAPTLANVIRSRAQRLRCSMEPRALMVPPARPTETPIAAGIPMLTRQNSLDTMTPMAGSRVLIASPSDSSPDSARAMALSKASAAICSMPKAA